MKAKLSLLLALVLAFTLVFSACDNKKQNEADGDEPVSDAPVGDTQEDASTGVGPAGKITVQVEEAWLPHYEAAAARVKEAYPDVEIEFITVGSFDHLDTIDSTDVMNPDVADVYAYPLDRLVNLADKEALAAFDAPALAQEVGGFDNFDNGIGAALKLGDNYFGIPYNIETLVIFANEANAAAEGIDLSQPLEITTVTKPETALLPIFDAWFGVALTNSAKVELLGKEGENQFFSDLAKPWAELSPEHQSFIEGIFNYWKLNFEANTPLFDAESGRGYIDDKFRSGNGGVVRLGGPWEINAVKELTNDGADLGIYPISQVTLNGQPLAHWQGGWALGINSRCEAEPEKLALAKAMIAELINPAHAVELFQATGKILENAGVDIYMNSELDEIDKKTIEAVINSYKDAVNRPLFREWGEVWDTYKNAVLSWNSVKPATPEEAYTQLEASFKSLLERH
ncbi:MAG: ABC transporter substrate-binding protein [Eubacteriales bacterium]|nr:ABC transporter substrate-binding protein [Eubacteriales bacterium]